MASAANGGRKQKNHRIIALALGSLRDLFEFIQWLDYCYGEDYAERHFDASLVPKEKVVIDTRKVKERQAQLLEILRQIKDNAVQ